MNAYVVGTLKGIGAESLQVNCVADHIHILCSLPRTVTIAKLVERIKTSSSKWIKMKSRRLASFQWQAGYGAFSVSCSNAEEVKTYIANQQEHYRTKSFQEEFRAFLARHGLEFDERCAWD